MSNRPKKSGRLLSLTRLFILGFITVLTTWLAPAHGRPPQKQNISPPVPSLKAMINPNPLHGDIELPMPCDGKLILRHVCVPANGYFGDLEIDLGCKDCGRQNQGFMEGKHTGVVSGSLTLEDLPEVWRTRLTELAQRGEGRCPNPNDKTAKGFYYFIGKFEISNFQWKTVMDGACPGSAESFSADDPRPKTGISWFEAVDFTRRYTEWLLKNRADALPRFPLGRFAYLRLPTEAEWEYAARGGHLVTEYQMNQGEFFPLKNRHYFDYAVYTDVDAARLPEKLAWIGSKLPNPLGLFDTAGNAAEMVLEPFRFSIDFRLHGATGGFIVKGGSFRKSKVEIMPGRREEMPYFLKDGAFRSTDLGFRVVLSAIVTPQNRNETLERHWSKAVGRTLSEIMSSAFTIDPDPSENLLSELDHLLTTSSSDKEHKISLFIRDFIKKNRTMLAAQKADTVKEIVWNALFAAESVMNYTIRRKEVLDELSMLNRMKAKTVSEFVLESLESDITKAQGTVSLCDAAINFFLQSYINRIRESQKYPDDIFESQLDLIFQELNLEEYLSHSMKIRLDLFKKHVALHKNQVASINQEMVLKDIIFTTSH
jgi:formylglycine-generating enzyme required for sulfatase activity